MRCTGGALSVMVISTYMLSGSFHSLFTGPNIALHNSNLAAGGLPESEYTGAMTSPVSSPHGSSNAALDGTWGERDAGVPVSHSMAMEGYEQMRRELTQLSQTRSRSTTRTRRTGILRTITGRSTKSRRTAGSKVHRRRGSTYDDVSEAEEDDLEAGDAEKEDAFELGEFIRDGHFEKRTKEGASAKKVGVVFKNLTVKGVGASASFVRTVPDAILGKDHQRKSLSRLDLQLIKGLRYIWPRFIPYNLQLRACDAVGRSRTDTRYHTRLHRHSPRW